MNTVLPSRLTIVLWGAVCPERSVPVTEPVTGSMTYQASPAAASPSGM
jgi:hypothetical protein